MGIKERLGTAQNAGAVQILYGTSSGLSSAGNQFWTQASSGIQSGPGSGDHFGGALVADNFGRDASGCFDDLAIGVPGETINGQAGAGAVHVLYGSATGISANDAQFWHQDTPGVPGTAASFEEFGFALASGSFRSRTSICGTNIADLAVGAPRDDNAGAVFVIHGTSSGLTSTNSQRWDQNSNFIQDESEPEDAFGFALATGHRPNEGDYLVIGAPGESVNSREFGGAVHILFSHPSTDGLHVDDNRFYHQDTPGIQDAVETGDQFGYSVSTGNFNGSGGDDLAIGVPFERLGGLPGAGSMHVFYGAEVAAAQYFHQEIPNIQDQIESGDNFGASLSR